MQTNCDNRFGYRELGFPVHGIDAEGNVIIRRKLKRLREVVPG